jgi:hypothetical protein
MCTTGSQPNDAQSTNVTLAPDPIPFMPAELTALREYDAAAPCVR